MQKVCLIKTSVGTMDAAEKLATALVEMQRAACVHISGPGRSIYRWQGKLGGEDEYCLTIKTSPSLRDSTVLYLTAAHPYELPEVIWREFDATDAYGDWVYGEVDASIGTNAQE